MKRNSSFFYMSIIIVIVFMAYTPMLHAQDGGDMKRIGMLGLDTSHVIAFTRVINSNADSLGCKVVAGYPGGSPDIESSITRVEGYTEKMHDEFGVTIMDSPEEVCEAVDWVMVMSVDGRPHLELAKTALDAGKPIWVDKPMAGNLEDVIAIFEYAEEKGLMCWSASSLRYNPPFVALLEDEEIGEVMGCTAISPCSLHETHPDLYWYGVHGVETLYTFMGIGCESVTRVHTEGADVVVGTWEDDRIGTFRGIRNGSGTYAAVVYGSGAVKSSFGFAGYDGLVYQIIDSFKTGVAPVPAEVTIEMFAFMSAADISKERGGKPVSLDEVLGR